MKMREQIIKFRNKITSFIYKYIFKSIAFRFDPEFVHDHMINFGKFLGKFSFLKRFTKYLFFYDNDILKQNILGINFANPVGLAAGFDKNAELVDILPAVGFGFAEVGSITGEPCAGNPKPRLWRLKKSKSIVVYYGLKNDGAVSISDKLKNKKFQIPIGISIAKTNNQETCELDAGISDYVKAFSQFIDIGDYMTINISCPNAFGGLPFSDPDKLDLLLAEIKKIKYQKPIFLKMPPDLADDDIDRIILLAKKYQIAGFICSNLTKNRENKKVKDKIKSADLPLPENGGLSGRAVQELSDDLISYIYQKTGGKFVIIGCGGIFSAEDAYKKIKSGASLLQMVTGLIFQGPQVVSEINQGLVKLLQQDGYKNISEAVGADYK